MATSKKIAELRKYDGDLFVQNNSHKFYSIRHRVGQDRLDLELTPAGTPDSIAPLPKLALELRGFQRAWNKGELTVSTDPDMQDQIDVLMHQHVAATDAKLAGMTEAALDRPNTARTLSEKPCLKCGLEDRNGAHVGNWIVQSLSDTKEGVPPLCDDHVDMAHLYSRTLKTDTKGEEYWDFSLVTVK